MGNTSSSTKITSTQFHSKIEMSKKTGVLTLPNSKIEEIPLYILSLTNLKSLDLSGNRITRMYVSQVKK